MHRSYLIQFFVKPILLFSFLLTINQGLNAQEKDSLLITSAVADTVSRPVSKKRIRLVASANVVGYGGALVALNAAWYSKYERSAFHTFNDNAEWLQVDKVGHAYCAYFESRYSSDMWKWAGLSRNKRIWIGGLGGAMYQTALEVLDGYSKEWGWSWGDFSANILGSGIFISQELAWDEQRVSFKFSFHKVDYKNPELNKRANEFFGATLAERSLKDYNAQTYWLSANIRSFFPKSESPRWLSLAVGYGADGMFGGTENLGRDKDGVITFDRRDIKRYRQWFLAPDVDFTKIRTNKKAVRIMLGVLNSFKFPAPSLELSKGNLSFNWLHF
ncbi:MAG: DUF2279 domain-containing protein [Chitinophagaceae bacterium]